MYEPQIQPLNPTSGLDELYDPEVTQMVKSTSFFYLRTTVPSFEDGITLNQWHDFCRGNIQVVDVFGDGLCGWFSLAICADKLKHNKKHAGRQDGPYTRGINLSLGWTLSYEKWRLLAK